MALYLRSATGTYPTARHTYAVIQLPSRLVPFDHQPGTYHADLMALSDHNVQWINIMSF